MATERKRRRSTSPQRSPGELADTLAQMAAGTKDPPTRRRPRLEIDPSLFAPPAEPAPSRSAVLAPERPPETSPSSPTKPPVLPESPATAPPATAPPAEPTQPPPGPRARAALVSDDVSGSSLRELRPGTMSRTPISPPADRPSRPPAKPRVPRSGATRDAARAAAAKPPETAPKPRDAAPAPKDPSPPAAPEDAAGGLAIGSRLGSGSASPRTERKPISRISGRSGAGRSSGRTSSDRTSSGRSKLRDRVGGRSGGLVTAQVAGSRFRSRASGQVGRRGSRAASRRPHLGRRFTLVVLLVIVLVLLALVLIDGSSNQAPAPASARPATTPVPVPPGSDRSTTPPAPAATTPAPTTPTTPTRTATTSHKAAAPAAKHKAKAAAHKVKRTAHKTTTASTSGVASQPSTTPATAAPVFRSPAPHYTPPPARQSLSGVGSLSGATTLSHRRAKHRQK